MDNNVNSFEDEDIVLAVKKSDIKRFFDGKLDINVKVYHTKSTEFMSNSIVQNQTINHNKLNLTSRQLEVLRYMALGMSNPKIAKELFVTRNTVKAHVSNILHKLEVSDRHEAAIKAINEKIV